MLDRLVQQALRPVMTQAARGLVRLGVGADAISVTGFAIGETDAVYARSGENAMLCAKDGETVYMIIAQADEQTLYALGVDAETK